MLALATFLVAGPALMARPGKRLALAGTPADLGLAFEAVSFRAPDRPLTLRAWWMPANAAKGALVMIHGGGEDNRAQPYSDGLKLARDLVRHGYSVLALDLRNYGESDASADGRITFGDDESYDVIGAVDWLAVRAPGLPVVAIGSSMGGEAALYAAVRDPRLAAVVTDGTFADARGIGASFVHAATGMPLVLARPFVWSAEHLHGLALDRGHAVDVVSAIAPRPVLLIHNEADPVVPVADARRLAAAIPGAELWITPAPPADHPLRASLGRFGTHVQSYRLDPSGYVARVIAFLTRALGGSPHVDTPNGR